MLVIFDVDGTLLGSESHDSAAFDSAVRSVLGYVPTDAFYEGVTEVTTKAIVRAAVAEAGLRHTRELEERIRDAFLLELQALHATRPADFTARPGAAALLYHLSRLPGTQVAIATGDWLPTILFKLAAAGLDVGNIPLASASDCERRADIIRLAAQRAGRSVEDAVYVGDGLWDLRACRELGIPLIGTGERVDLLRAAGAAHILQVFETAAFMTSLQLAGTTKLRTG